MGEAVILLMIAMSTSLLNTSVPFEGHISATNISHPTIEAQIAPNHLVIIKDVAMALMIGVTGTGNALVILSFVVDANLRTQSNFFLLNLAICDFCIGTFSTPLYMINYIMNGKWILGRPVCKMWLAIDYVICQCSIYSIILISYDRFLAVTKAVAYRDQQHRMKAAVLKMMATWILAFLVYGPVILFWEYIAGYSNVPDGECNPEFFYNQYFRLWSSIIFFFTPLVPILYFNMNVYINVRTRMKAKQRPLGAPAGKPKARSDTTPIFTVPYLRSTETNINSSPEQGRRVRPTATLKEIHVFKNILPNVSSNAVVVLQSPTDNKPKISSTTKPNDLLSMDVKIAKSLSILVGTFCFCWAPYSLLLIFRELCQQDCIPAELSDATYLFTYLNSSLNPFIYPLCHPAFKKTFIKILFPLVCRLKIAQRKPGNVRTRGRTTRKKKNVVKVTSQM